MFPLIKLRFQPARGLSQHAIQNISKIGFIGLGQMGYRMCKNLMKKGYDVTVYDTNREAIDKLVKEGARPTKDVTNLTGSVECIITMLPVGKDVLSLYSPEIIKSIKPGALVIDSSTVEHTVSQEVEAKLKKADISFMDAPVSGGVLGAENATLTFMVGGDPNELERASPILKAMGASIYHCGTIGSGQIAKVCNNLILGITMAGLSEALAVGISLGLNPNTLVKIINTSTGQCWSSTVYNPIPGICPNAPSSKGYEGGFSTQLIHKDLGIANRAAENIGLPLQIGKKTYEMYDAMCKNGLGKSDFSVIYEYIRSMLKQK